MHGLEETRFPRRAGSAEPGPQECAPKVEIPAWWCGFLFHVLNPRQIAMYVYLTMLCEDTGVCHPTIEQIRKDLSLLSATMVFESMSVLEEYGFFLRTRRSFPDTRSKRNVYQRTACEYTILRLLECGRIDGDLRPADPGDAGGSEESLKLVTVALEGMLGAHYDRYKAAPAGEKKNLLIEILTDILHARGRGIYQ